jgi:FMN-dependent oxidoreductase (nitrilotriacetate monooxygenase family)
VLILANAGGRALGQYADMSKPFHLSWFLGQSFASKNWRSMWAGSASDVQRWMMPDLFIDLAQGMERACMDYMIIEDSSNVPYTYKGNHDTYLQYAQGTPKLDPPVLVPWLAQATQHLGLVPTLSVSEYPPYLLARLINSLDHVTEGRIGWNCVTGSNDGTAQNYGHDKHRPHDERYEVADEFADVVTRLWEAWEPDAMVLDPTIPMFAYGKKVRPINHEGKYFKVRGPINAPRSPQGRVPIVQAGGSQAGKKFASKWADTIITEGVNIERMKEYRQQVRRDATAIGRNPDDIKVLFLCSPIVDTTMEAALERRRLQQEDSLKYVDMQLSGMSRLTGIDFSKFDLDEPLPMTLKTNGHQSSLARWLGKPLREIVRTYASKGSLDYTGTPDHVAGMMQDVMQEVGGDGFLISNTAIDRRYVMEVCDGLVPELQRRGLTRKAYAHKHLRDNLLEF